MSRPKEEDDEDGGVSRTYEEEMDILMLGDVLLGRGRLIGSSLASGCKTLAGRIKLWLANTPV